MPLYDQISDAIMKAIETNRLKEGIKLPAEMEPGKEFGVSRPTICNATSHIVFQTMYKGAF